MAIHSRILHNGRICNSESLELRAGQVGLLAGWGVFTTLRISEGMPFAWERHWARMSRDAAQLHVPMPPESDAVELDLLRLIEANGRDNCTLRLVLVRNSGGMFEGAGAGLPLSDVIALTADSKKWNPCMRLGLQTDARFAGNEFAGAKVLSWAHNLTWIERAQNQGLDEVVLLNQHGRVAECTSANIFAVFGNQAVTAPLAEGCLPGITREILLSALRVDGISVIERSLSPEDLYDADEVFITSTTRDLIPVSEIAGRATGRAATVRERLASAFKTYLKNDIAHRKSAQVLV